MTSVAKSWDEVLTGGVKAGDAINYDSISSGIRGLSDTIDNEVIIRNIFANLDADFLADVLKNLDADVATRIAKGLSDESVTAILKAAGDGADDLAARIGRQSTTSFGAGDEVVYIGNTAYSKQQLLDIAEAFQLKPIADARGSAKAAEATTTLKNADDAADENTIRQAVKNVVPDLSDAELDNLVNKMQTTLKNSDEAKQAMGALGFVKQSWGNFTTWTAKNWYKLGAALFLLCLMYDTDNPFTALKRAVDDAGVFVRGLKDVADKTVQSGKNAFDILAWVTGNPFVSVGSSAACVIMMLSIGVSSMK